VPGWHDATRRLRAEGRLRMVGIIQEQHPERCALFMQWQDMDWPILVDSLNLTGTRVVPRVYFLDGHGVVRAIRPEAAALPDLLALDLDPPPIPDPPVVPYMVGLTDLRARAAADGAGPRAWRDLGDALFLRGDGDDDLDAAVAAYERAAALDPDDGAARFRLGVALRRRFEGPTRRPADFAAAAEAWTRALALDPGQYIWRRRIQQYGPLLDKPYPFYGWIERARRELRARGAEPLPLRIEPRGSELAGEARLEPAGPAEHPDPDGRLPRDAGLVAVEPALVPSAVEPGGTVRLHLVLRCGPDATWNDEAGRPAAWLDLPPGWRADRRLVEGPTDEPGARVLEVELGAPAGAQAAGRLEVTAFYDVCREADGVCQYLRQDLVVEVPVAER